MRPSRKPLTDLIVGGTLSIVFGGFLFYQILASNVDNYDDFLEFLEDPGNFLFCLLMSMFTLASWLMKGVNNRAVLFCWASMVVFNSFIYFSVSHYFSYEFKNVYALSCVGLAASIPVVILMRFRVSITTIICEKLWKTGLLKNSTDHYLRVATTTNFEFDMRLALYGAFIVEFLYSLYMTSYAALHSISHNSSISEHMSLYKNWQPFDLYYSSLNIVGTVYILIIAWHLFRDYNSPDSFGDGLTETDRKNAGLRLLEKSRRNPKK